MPLYFARSACRRYDGLDDVLAKGVVETYPGADKNGRRLLYFAFDKGSGRRKETALPCRRSR